MSSDEEDYAEDYEDDIYSSDNEDEPENDNVRILFHCQEMLFDECSPHTKYSNPV